LLVLPFFIAYAKIILGNGGAWQTKIQETGNASASKTEKHTTSRWKTRH
jgi:hypothetical protein